ncbi:MAG: phosphoheptose isomerase [Chloroflexi bacterium]|nr:MAG: phosphoheptose isomerase [Chloroflexota bacterium]
MNHFAGYTREMKQTLDRLPFDQLETMVSRLHQARLDGKQIFVIGNGGSAATATHLACDLGKNTVAAHVPRFRVMALTDNMALLSAVANDLGYENVFAEQLSNFIQTGDVVIAISASGNSANVLKAIELAKVYDALTVGWSGYDGGRLATLADIPIVVPNHCIEQIEDVHLMLAHMVTGAVRQAAADPILFPRQESIPYAPAVNGNGAYQAHSLAGGGEATG